MAICSLVLADVTLNTPKINIVAITHDGSENVSACNIACRIKFEVLQVTIFDVLSKVILQSIVQHVFCKKVKLILSKNS